MCRREGRTELRKRVEAERWKEGRNKQREKEERKD